MHQTTKLQAVQASFDLIKRRYGEIRDLVHTQLRWAALTLMMDLFREELDEVCGKRFARKRGQDGYRGGSDPGSVMLQGQRVAVKKPRIRRDGRDVELATYQALQGSALLDRQAHAVRRFGAGIRNALGRDCGRLRLEPELCEPGVRPRLPKMLDEINGRDLLKESFVAILINSLEFADRSVTVAMEVTRIGQNWFLGLQEGDTENWEVCKDLLQSLVDRGLSPDLMVLFGRIPGQAGHLIPSGSAVSVPIGGHSSDA